MVEKLDNFHVMVHHSRISWGLRSANVGRFKSTDTANLNQPLVMLTVQTFAEGLDVPKIDCLLLVRPTFSQVLLKQMIGRGLRGPKLGGTEGCDIYDFTYILQDRNGVRIIRKPNGAIKRVVAPPQPIANTPAMKRAAQLLANLPRNRHWRRISEVRENMTQPHAMLAAESLYAQGLVEYVAQGAGGRIRLL